LADLHPRQGNLHTSKEQIFSGLQNLSSLHKIGCRSAEKNSPVSFNMRVLDLRFLCCYLDPVLARLEENIRLGFVIPDQPVDPIQSFSDDGRSSAAKDGFHFHDN
jgi:hypothetical protein